MTLPSLMLIAGIAIEMIGFALMGFRPVRQRIPTQLPMQLQVIGGILFAAGVVVFLGKLMIMSDSSSR